MQFIEKGKFFIGKLGKYLFINIFLNIYFRSNLVDKTGLEPGSRIVISSKLKK